MYISYKNFFLVVLCGLAVLGYFYFQKNEVQVGNLGEQKQIYLYLYNPNIDKDQDNNILCSTKGLVPVQRKVKDSEYNVENAIKQLIKGDVTLEEKSKGLTTEFPLRGLTFLRTEQKGIEVKLYFEDPEFRSSGGACRVQIMRNQIEATARQFPGVSIVEILPRDAFQP